MAYRHPLRLTRRRRSSPNELDTHHYKNDKYYNDPYNVPTYIRDGSLAKIVARDAPELMKKPGWEARERARRNADRAAHPSNPQGPALPPIPGRQPPNQASRYYHYDPVHTMPYEGVSARSQAIGPGGYGFGRPPVFVNPAPEALHPLQPLPPPPVRRGGGAPPSGGAGIVGGAAIGRVYEDGSARLPAGIGYDPDTSSYRASYNGGSYTTPMSQAMREPGQPQFKVPNNALGRFVSSHYSRAIQEAVFKKLLRNEFAVPAQYQIPLTPGALPAPRRRRTPNYPVIIEE